MNSRELIWISIFLIGVLVFFFYKTFFLGLIPFPGDLLVSHYNPWKSYSYLGYTPASFPSKDQYFDTLRQLYPWRTVSTDMLSSFEVPLWNPYNFSGSPLLANNQSAVFYPLTILYVFLPQVTAWTVLVILQLFLCSFFTYLFARTIGIGRIGGVFSAIAFSYSLFMTVFLQYNTIGHVIAFLPLSLFAFERLRKNPSIFWYVLLSLSMAFFFLAGHLQIAGFNVAFFILYVLFRTKNIAILLQTFLFVFLGLGMAAIQLIPTFELISLSARAFHDYQFFIEKLLIQPSQLILLFSPDFFGNPATRNYLLADSYPGNALSIGLFPLLFALFAIPLFKKHPNVRFFATFSFVLLFLVTRSPLTELLYRFEIPFFSTGSPTNALYLFAFSTSLVSGFGIEYWISKRDRMHSNTLFLISMLFLIIWGAILLHHIETVSVRNFIYATVNLGIFAVLFFIGQALTKKRTIIAYICLFLAIFDLFYFFQKFNPFVPSAIVAPKAEIFEWLSKNSHLNRFWGYGSAAIEANFATQYRLFSPDGYDPLYPKRYGSFIQSSGDGKIKEVFTSKTRSDALVAPGFGETDLPENPYRLKVLDFLGVRYVLDRIENGTTEKTFPKDRFKLVYANNGWSIFENLNALKRAFLVSDYQVFHTKEEFERLFFSPTTDLAKTVLLEEDIGRPLNKNDKAGKLDVRLYSPNRIVFATDTISESLLFLSDTYYPGWKAFVDGKETRIYRANFSFRAVVVPKGEHEVVFRFMPVSFSIGVKMTIISIVLLVGAVYVLARRKKSVK